MFVSQGEQTGRELGSFLKVAKTGIRRAAEAMDRMSGSSIQMDATSAGMAPTTRLVEITGDPDAMVVGVYVRTEGDIPGHSILIFPIESALLLIDIIGGLAIGTTKEIGHIERSMIQEVGNIVTAGYLNAISDAYGRTLLPCPPTIEVDKARNVIDGILTNTNSYGEDTLRIITRIACNRCVLRGFFLYIPNVSVSI